MSWRPQAPRARRVLLVLTALVALQAVVATVSFVRATRSGEGSFQFPLPARVAAIIESLEALPPERRDTLLTAVSTEDFQVAVADTPPQETGATDRFQLPQVAEIVDLYVDALGNRTVRAWLAAPDQGPLLAPRLEALRLFSPHPMRLAISLKPDGWLLIESRDYHASSVYGAPPGLIAGILGVIVATLTLLTLWRGLSPLEQLSRSVARFGERPEPDPVRPRGPRETRAIIEAVNGMQRQLAASIRERELTFSALSHDLRTYLTRLRLRIVGIAETDRRQQAEQELMQMSAIIEDALTLARLDSADRKRDRFTIGELLAELETQTGLTAPKRAENLMAEELAGDQLALLRGLQNLIDNAQRYGGSAALAVRQRDDLCEIEISDRGPGIPPADYDRLRQPLERGEQARTLDVPGSGLGLAIADRAARRADGKLSLHQRPGGGLIARLSLPLLYDERLGQP